MESRLRRLSGRVGAADGLGRGISTAAKSARSNTQRSAHCRDESERRSLHVLEASCERPPASARLCRGVQRGVCDECSERCRRDWRFTRFKRLFESWCGVGRTHLHASGGCGSTGISIEYRQGKSGPGRQGRRRHRHGRNLSGASTWELKELQSGPNRLAMTSNPDGSAWLLIGTDSGFEGRTTLYYARVIAQFFPQ